MGLTACIQLEASADEYGDTVALPPRQAEALQLQVSHYSVRNTQRH